MNRLYRLALAGLLIALTGCGRAAPSPTSLPQCGPDPVGLECSVAQDPFELPALGASPNCGPEGRFETGVTIESRQQFREYLATHDLGQMGQFDNFRDERKFIEWDRIERETAVMHAPDAVIYQLVYSPSICAEFELRIRADGRASIYGCCGK